LPIKQGGLAAQQAEAAASDIAAAAGLLVEPRPFRPVVRGALLTGEEPVFLRADVAGGGEGQMARSPMWWPPLKVAAPRLGPYLAQRWGGTLEGMNLLEDLDRSAASPRAEDEHREALRVALSFADLDARHEEYDDALRWLDVAEQLNVTLPHEYEERRRRWRQLADGSVGSPG
jgi:sulfide:quinone oxidoreductase